MNINIYTFCSCPIKYRTWGDYSYVLCIKSYFIKKGFNCNIIFRPDWYKVKEADINICISGWDIFKPSNSKCLNILWIISHPSFNKELQLYDHVFVASNTYKIPHKSTSPLLQGCNNLYISNYKMPIKRHSKMLFLGTINNRHRTSLEYAKNSNVPLIVLNNIDYPLIGKVYNQFNLVLNDHHFSMKTNGFINNRVYDVIASNTKVLSDYVFGLNFNNCITYKTYNDFINSINNLNYKIDLEESKYIRNEHSLYNRAEEILKFLDIKRILV